MKAFDRQKAEESRKHEYWIGGASCGGKSTISKRLAAEFGFVLCDGDSHHAEHNAKATREDYRYH